MPAPYAFNGRAGTRGRVASHPETWSDRPSKRGGLPLSLLTDPTVRDYQAVELIC